MQFYLKGYSSPFYFHNVMNFCTKQHIQTQDLIVKKLPSHLVMAKNIFFSSDQSFPVRP